MTFKQPFDPKYGSNQVLTAGAAALVATIDKANKQVRIVNSGANGAHIRCYSSQASPVPVASTADFFIPAGMASVITKDGTHDQLSYISALGTTLHVITGEGV